MFTRPGTRRNAFSKVSVDALVEAEGSCAFQATDTPQVTIALCWMLAKFEAQIYSQTPGEFGLWRDIHMDS